MKQQTSIVLTIIISCILFTSCIKEDKKNYERKPIPVKVMKIDTISTENSIVYIGTVEENTNIPLSFLSGGTVTSVKVKSGAKVSAGQTLATIDNTQVRNMLSSAQAKLKQAEDGYNRISQVYEAGGATEVKLIEIRTQRDEARGIVTSLQKQLSDCALRAPQDGIIGSCEIKTGENILPGQRAMTLLGMESLNVKINVPETEIGNIHIGDKARLAVSALNDSILYGQISSQSIMPNRLTHSYEIIITLDSTYQTESLLPGMVCRVSINTNNTHGYILPGECIQIGQNGKTVWLIRDGKAIRTEIETGAFVRDGVLITEGLQQGDEVVISGFHKLYNGCEVIIH